MSARGKTNKRSLNKGNKKTANVASEPAKKRRRVTKQVAKKVEKKVTNKTKQTTKQVKSRSNVKAAKKTTTKMNMKQRNRNIKLLLKKKYTQWVKDCKEGKQFIANTKGGMKFFVKI